MGAYPTTAAWYPPHLTLVEWDLALPSPRSGELICPFPSTSIDASRPPCAAEITINLSALRPDIRAEWDELKQHDVLFLLTIRPPDSITRSYMAQAKVGGAPAAPAAPGCRRASIRRHPGCGAELHPPLRLC